MQSQQKDKPIEGQNNYKQTLLMEQNNKHELVSSFAVLRPHQEIEVAI